MGVHRDCGDEEDHSGRRRSRTQKIYLRSGADDLFPGTISPRRSIKESTVSWRTFQRSSPRDRVGHSWPSTGLKCRRLNSTRSADPRIIPSPERIANTQARVSTFENKNDNFCFLYCVAASVLKFRRQRTQALQISKIHIRTENRRSKIPFAVIPDPQIRETQPRIQRKRVLSRRRELHYNASQSN